MDKLKIVIDVDDTICDNNNRQYKDAIPKRKAIEKLNLLHSQGYEIILYTARGMKSCNGDLDKIIKKNKDVLETWLKENNVQYDELIFGKPLGDLYIDDKCMEVREFIQSEFCTLSGGSNLQTKRMGRYVVKELGSVENVNTHKEWCHMADIFNINHPKLISTLYDRIYIDYIRGNTLANVITSQNLKLLFKKIVSFRSKDIPEKFELTYHLENVKKNDIDGNIHQYVEKCVQMLQELKIMLYKNRSFSHGDCILSNIIETPDEKLYFLDEHWTKNASSYLFDLAKIRMSLENYDYYCHFSTTKIDESLLKTYDDMLKKYHIYNVCLVLEYMHIIRAYRYKKTNEEKQILINMLKKLESEMKHE